MEVRPVDIKPSIEQYKFVQEHRNAMIKALREALDQEFGADAAFDMVAALCASISTHLARNHPEVLNLIIILALHDLADMALSQMLAEGKLGFLPYHHNQSGQPGN
jgi:hypothetical protein